MHISLNLTETDLNTTHFISINVITWELEN